MKHPLGAALILCTAAAADATKASTRACAFKALLDDKPIRWSATAGAGWPADCLEPLRNGRAPM